MNKINIISPDDKLYNDAYSILMVCPSGRILLELQKWLLTIENTSINVYVFNESSSSNLQWLLDVFHMSNIVIVDVDNITSANVKEILSYMIAKPKTYWLTLLQNSVYNYISNNKVYDLSFLSNTGVLDVKKQ